MVKAEEHITGLNREAMDAATALARIAVENAEKLVQLQLETLRATLDDSLRGARDLAQVKDPQQYAAQRAKAVEHGVERMMDYSGKMYELVAATQAEIGRLMEARLAAVGREMSRALDDAAKAGPAGAAPAVDAIRQSLAATNAMIETLSKTARQFAQAADVSVKSAAGAVKPRAKKRT